MRWGKIAGHLINLDQVAYFAVQEIGTKYHVVAQFGALENSSQGTNTLFSSSSKSEAEGFLERLWENLSRDMLRVSV